MSVVELAGRRVKVSSLDKVLYPETGFTKGDLIDYYAQISEALTPHLRGRPLSLRRFPKGVGEDGFWSKRCPPNHPDWIETAPIWSHRRNAILEYCTVSDLPSLIWTVNLETIELHVPLARADAMPEPTMMVFDLDPGPPANILDCAEVALVLHELFEQLGLRSFAKTSGSKGLQIYTPLNTAVTYEQTSPFAHAVARAFEGQYPDQVVSRMLKKLRPGKVLIDWSQNNQYKTTVCVYSVRATDRPRVSTPITWDEVAEALQSGDRTRLDFSPADVLNRVAEQGDLFAPTLKLRQTLPPADALG